MRIFYVFLFFFLMVSCKSNSQEQKSKYLVSKSDAEWKEQLPKMAYYVLRKAGTERAFSGSLNYNKEDGIYVCAGCQAPLYESKYKFDSGTGWPSFDRGNEENLEYDIDYKIGYPRSELKCNKCGGHLGHMFSDGPKATTGKRHCINSAALNFIASNE
jgi:peptide-methionine (R)-S-oxide reductase|tara:strand:- start:437 stop:910 length:474 start_codon:yes stop_codon:yes gene_type:complete